MAKISKVRIRRLAVEAVGISWAPVMFLGTWHAMQFHPISYLILAGYLVAGFGLMVLYAYLAYGKLY